MARSTPISVALRYRLQYVDRVAPDFVPAALALGSGTHGAAALLFRGIASGRRLSTTSKLRPRAIRRSPMGRRWAAARLTHFLARCYRYCLDN